MKKRDRLKQILIAIDQLINTFVWYGDSFCDETLSAKAYRMTDTSIGWRDFHVCIDWVFKVFFKEDNHCYKSYLAEIKRSQLPKEYQVRIYADFFSPK